MPIGISVRAGIRALMRVAVTADNPPTGQRLLYAKTDGWYDRDAAGVELKMAAPELFFQDTVPAVHGPYYQRFDSAGNWFIEDGLP